jgi:quinol monooxygenase YgiN
VILIAGTIDLADPARRDECLAATVPLQEASRAEPGCQAYVMAADPVVAGRIVVFEEWVDAASLEAHFQHPNYLDNRRLLTGFGIASFDFWKHRTDARDRVYSPEWVPSARFWSVE